MFNVGDKVTVRSNLIGTEIEGQAGKIVKVTDDKDYPFEVELEDPVMGLLAMAATGTTTYPLSASELVKEYDCPNDN